MAQYVYTMNRVGKIVPPKRQILKDISLSFFPGAKIGVLGVNGSGKSTLLKIMAGKDHEIEGEAVPMPGLKIGHLEQEPKLDAAQTVREAVEEGIGGVLAAKKRLDEVYAEYAEPDADFDKLAAEQAELEAIIAAAGSENTDLQLELAADALRLPPWDATIETLSGGEKRRVALCRLLLSKPDMLLLDEPTNHLDAESVEWLEHFLQRFPGTVVAITHDRYFLDNAAEWILELDRGMGIPWKGNYSDWLDQKEQRLEQEQKKEDARIKAMKEELKWVRSNAKGRQSKSKARLARFEELSDVEYQRRNETNEIFIPVAERLGNEVIEFKNVSKSFGHRMLIDNLSFKIPPGAIVGIIGPNGAGEFQQRFFQCAQGLDVEVVRRFVEQQHVAAFRERLRQVQPAALAAGQRTDHLLLIVALEVEAAKVRTRRHHELADDDVVEAAGDVLPHGLAVVEILAALVDERELGGLADQHLA